MSDKGLSNNFKCADCGKEIPDWEAYERNGKIYGRCCLLKTVERRTQEKWLERFY